MNNLNEGLLRLDNTVSNWLLPLKTNDYVVTVVILVLILYAGLLVQRLPEYVVKVFDHPLVKLLALLVVAYVAKMNPTVGIISAIAFLVTLQVLNKHKTNHMMMALVEREMEREKKLDTQFDMQLEEQEEPVNNHNNTMHGEPVFENAEIPTKSVSQESLQHLQEQNPNELTQQMCQKKVSFRDEFYPQYVNMKPDAYLARDNSGEVQGFDEYASYMKNYQ